MDSLASWILTRLNAFRFTTVERLKRQFERSSELPRAQRNRVFSIRPYRIYSSCDLFVAFERREKEFQFDGLVFAQFLGSVNDNDIAKDLSGEIHGWGLCCLRGLLG